MPNLKLTDLKWGTLNNIRENDSNASGDRRRTSPVTALRFATEKAFEINTLTGIKEFNGIVLHSRIVTYASYQNRASLLETFVRASPPGEAENVDFPSFVYKVLIPELEPRPTPLSLDDPVIATYPDIYTDFESETPLEKGQLVAITYEDAENLFNPRITRVINKPLSIGGCEDIENAQKSFKKGKSKVLGAPPRRTASSPESPAGLQYNEFRTGSPEWTAIQIHYTVTFNTNDAISVLRKRGFSYHYIIGKDGTVTTAVDPAKAVAIHAGSGGPGGNQTRIGISFVNLGYDSQYAGGGWGGRTSPPIEEWESFPPTSLKWEPYTPAAIRAGKTLVRQLVAQFPGIKTIFGHEDTSRRKLDPGPAFDKYWPEYEALLPNGRGSVARSTKERGNQ